MDFLFVFWITLPTVLFPAFISSAISFAVHAFAFIGKYKNGKIEIFLKSDWSCNVQWTRRPHLHIPEFQLQRSTAIPENITIKHKRPPENPWRSLNFSFHGKKKACQSYSLGNPWKRVTPKILTMVRPPIISTWLLFFAYNL